MGQGACQQVRALALFGQCECLVDVGMPVRPLLLAREADARQQDFSQAIAVVFGACLHPQRIQFRARLLQGAGADVDRDVDQARLDAVARTA